MLLHVENHDEEASDDKVKLFEMDIRTLNDRMKYLENIVKFKKKTKNNSSIYLKIQLKITIENNNKKEKETY